jgi:hypothetical protein
MAEGDGGIFGIPQDYFNAGGAALGAGNDFFSFIQQMQQRSQQRRIADILGDPRRLSQYIGGLFKPMGQAENAAVQRDLGANWSVMTGGAPGGAMNQFVADALAKIESQRYQSASQNALQALTGASGAAGSYSNIPGGMLGGIMKSLQILKQLRGGGESGGGLANIPGFQDYRAGERSAYPMPTTEQAGAYEGYS